MKKVAIITGASAGLGAEFARQIDKQQQIDELWLVARRTEKMQALAAQLSHQTKIITADLSSPTGVDLVLKELRNEVVTLLVNNAGFGKNKRFSETDTQVNIEMAYLNMIAPLRLVQGCLSHMQRGSGIINIASIAGFAPYTPLNLYAATKAFLLHFSLGLRNELDSKGIKVLTVCPGLTKTEFQLVASEGKSVHEVGDEPSLVVAKALQDYRWRAVSIYGIIYSVGAFVIKVLPKALVAYLSKNITAW